MYVSNFLIDYIPLLTESVAPNIMKTSFHRSFDDLVIGFYFCETTYIKVLSDKCQGNCYTGSISNTSSEMISTCINRIVLSWYICAGCDRKPSILIFRVNFRELKAMAMHFTFKSNFILKVAVIIKGSSNNYS